MMSWRTITAGVLVAAATAPAAFALGNCAPNVQLKQVFPLVMCPERQDTNNNNIGGYFPWRNSSFFFANYRNQFLYPSSTIQATAVRAVTLESLHTRESSFTGAATYNFGAAGTQWIRVRDTTVSDTTMSKTFSLNDTLGEFHLNWNGPKVIGTASGAAFGGPGGSNLSDFVSRGANIATRNDLDKIFDFRDPAHNPADPKFNILFDQLMRINPSGSSGFAVWDITSGACSQPKLCYGYTSFIDPNYLTTAFGIAPVAFIWVFHGLATPPPATVQMQISEIVRLLLTPESLRCSFLNLTIDKKVGDDAIAFPAGKDYDPISPLVSAGAKDSGARNFEDSSRSHGWN